MGRFKRKNFITLIIVVILLSLGCFWYFNIRNPYGDYLEISNLGNYTSGKPSNKNTLFSIKHLLYTTVNLNLKEKIKSNSVNDIFIRNTTFSQTFSEEKGVYTVHFIVDIKSLKQSYRVSYQWTKDGKWSDELDEYGTGVSCLPLDELIYSDFKCVDDRIKEQGTENYDPIAKLLPYDVGSKYIISDYEKVDDNEGGSQVILSTQVYLKKWESEPDPVVLQQYEIEIKDWLKSKKLDPDNYSINFN